MTTNSNIYLAQNIYNNPILSGSKTTQAITMFIEVRIKCSFIFPASVFRVFEQILHSAHLYNLTNLLICRTTLNYSFNVLLLEIFSVVSIKPTTDKVISHLSKFCEIVNTNMRVLSGICKKTEFVH